MPTPDRPAPSSNNTPATNDGEAAQTPAPSSDGEASNLQVHAPMSGKHGEASNLQVHAPMSGKHGEASSLQVHAPMSGKHGEAPSLQVHAPMSGEHGEASSLQVHPPMTGERGEATLLPSHHLELCEGWRVWRSVVLRGAGFPAAWVAKLAASEETIGAVDEYLAGRGERGAVEAKLALAGAEISRVLRELAREPLFREALLWQNKNALHNGVDPLLRAPLISNAKTRPHERMVANYLQRYCLKNDTIGFFGPICWAELTREGPAVTADPKPALLSKRTVYFERWAIDVLAQQFAEHPDLRINLAPRRMPLVRIEGTTLHHPIARRSELPPDYARLLAACDGEKTARQLAAELGSSDADEIYEMLQELVDRRLATWTIELSPNATHPEHELRTLLERLPPSNARTNALDALHELEAARDQITKAAGDPTALERALLSLDAEYTELTQHAPTRAAGKTYAGRNLVFEECRRGLHLSLGPGFLQPTGPALGLILESARWYSFEVTRRYRARFEEIYRALAAESGDPEVDYLRFAHHAAELFSDDLHGGAAPALIREVTAELQARWATILDVDPSASRIDLRSELLRPKVEAAFAAPPGRWLTGLHSPDLMIAAKNIDAIRRGEFRVVLGELHIAVSMVAAPPFLKEHDDPGEIARAFEADIPQSLIASAGTPEENATRLNQGPSVLDLHARSIGLESGAARSLLPRARVLAVADLVVENLEGQLTVRTRDGNHTFDITTFYLTHLIQQSTARFSAFPPAPHYPRITIDNLVVSRERWQFSPEQLTFAHKKTQNDRFLEARRWKSKHGLPRYAFYKIPEEPKPCYVDFDSPVYVEIFAKLARKSTQLTLSEMLPRADQAWLEDAQGRTYTSELRLVVVQKTRVDG